ncbi:MAG TPA: GxxExxY protein [Cyclobacteriaceae bacterium]|nr:GxxExxY protein [Cyclobacteriaceae bacterium]
MFNEDITKEVIGCAIEVHRELGPGLLESAYEACLCFVLNEHKISAKRQVPIPLTFHGMKLNCGYRADLIIENKVILEIKAIEAINDIHVAQLLTYLKLTKMKTGLIINFNVPVLKQGIIRLVN